MERNTNNDNFNENIKLSILEYRERERRRYLKYKSTSASKTNCLNNDNENDIKHTKGNSREPGKKNNLESSDGLSSSINMDEEGTFNSYRCSAGRNGLDLSDKCQPACANTNSLSDMNELYRNKVSKTTETQQETLDIDSKDTATEGSSKANGMKRTKNPSRSSSIINSVKTWASSIVNNSNRTNNIHRSSGSSRCLQLQDNRMSNGTQVSNASTYDLNRGARGDEYSTDEELARRIQIEEFNAINSLQTNEDYIYYPSSQGFETLRDMLPTHITRSSNESLKPFKGPRYNIETLKLSEDESEDSKPPV